MLIHLKLLFSVLKDQQKLQNPPSDSQRRKATCPGSHSRKITCECESVSQSCPTLCDLMDCSPRQAALSMEFSRQEYWSGLPFPSPGDLPNPNPGPLHCRWISYLLRHQRSPSIVIILVPCISHHMHTHTFNATNLIANCYGTY